MYNLYIINDMNQQQMCQDLNNQNYFPVQDDNNTSILKILFMVKKCLFEAMYRLIKSADETIKLVC